MEKSKLIELITELSVQIIFIGLLGWAILLAFSLTWGQALLISWAFNRILEELSALRKK